MDEAKLKAMLKQSSETLSGGKQASHLYSTAEEAIPAGLGGWSLSGCADSQRLLQQRLCRLPPQTRPSPTEQLQQTEHGRM